MSTSNVPVPVPDHAPHGGGHLVLATGGRSLADMKAWLKELKAFVLDILVEGVDYGTEPGIPDKFLHKPGAEKLLMVYGLTAEFFPIESDTIREWSANPPHIQFAFRCVLTHRSTGMHAGEGSGIASTWESKYRYRAEWWNKPGDPPDGEGWKKTKSGWRKQTTNPDISDVVNTVLKMAQKRAQVDAVLRVTATSNFFKSEIDEAKIRDEEAEAAADELAKKVGEVVERINKAETLESLQRLSVEIAALGKSIAKDARVRSAYKARSAAFKKTEPKATRGPEVLPGAGAPEPEDGATFEDPGPTA